MSHFHAKNLARLQLHFLRNAPYYPISILRGLCFGCMRTLQAIISVSVNRSARCSSTAVPFLRFRTGNKLKSLCSSSLRFVSFVHPIFGAKLVIVNKLLRTLLPSDFCWLKKTRFLLTELDCWPHSRESKVGRSRILLAQRRAWDPWVVRSR